MKKVIIMFALAMGIVTANAQERNRWREQRK